MSQAPKKDRKAAAVRIMTLVSVALAVMCAALAWAWSDERDKAECWRTAAEFQLPPDGGCSG